MAESKVRSAAVTANSKGGRDMHQERNSAGEETLTSYRKPKRVSNSVKAIKKIKVEKVIVLSFHTLQLKRIVELQDDLPGTVVSPSLCANTGRCPRNVEQDTV